MKVIFNGILRDDSEIILSDLYRAVFFADGIFESIYLKTSEVYLFEFHLKRLLRGMNALSLEFSEPEVSQHLLNQITELKKHYPQIESARIKIVVWRKGKGNYDPQTERKANYLITLDESPLFQIKEIQNISVSKDDRLITNSYDNLKSLAGLPYVLGNIEKDSEIEELILLDFKGNVSEGLSSNIIIFRDREFHIPNKYSAFVSGCMLKYLTQRFIDAGFTLLERNIQYDSLKTYDFVLFCNSFSVKYKTLQKRRPDLHDLLKVFIEEQPKRPLSL